MLVQLLNVRSGAGLGYEVIGQVKEGDTVKVLDAVMSDSDVWIKSEKGWICAVGNGKYIG